MSVPSKMRAIGIREPGEPDVLVLQQRTVPAPGVGEILVKVEAAGVNRPDVAQRRGLYPPPPGAPDIPGLEIGGTVVALGQSASRWKIGDRVMALVIGGGYAEYCTAHESHALPAGNLDFKEAGAIPETLFTVWHNVFERGQLKAGQTILIHGGTSGIGTMAIQLAKNFGAKVITTAGTDEKCKAARDLGADIAVNYKTEDFVARTKQATDNKGVEVILDLVGGDYIPRNYEAAAVEGRIVQIASAVTSTATVNFGPLMVKRLTHTGSTLRARPVADKAAIARAAGEAVLPLLQAGKLKPVIDSTFPFAEAARAHARIEGGQHIGKIVLTMADK